MRDAQPTATYLKDYRPPAFLIETTELGFELGEEVTRVISRLRINRNPAYGSERPPLVLDGQQLALKRVVIDGVTLQPAQYIVDADSLTIANVPDTFEFECETEILPQQNTSLEGLYKSRTMFCTQCEAEGFRKITYYVDRPDVMSVFTTTIVADASRYPVLLSNGNLVGNSVDADGRTRVVWNDPFKKPCYLFALVAGDLRHIEDHFTTQSGRDVTLRIYVEEKDLDKCDHAMLSLKHSMRWDEEVYGREYDLDIFMIVAVDDFNMGAMENKGLNIFNTSCVLANIATTTDTGFQRVEAVVAHEYFHNWSGNRVTCRDWFQLSLKEGFTVYRDAEFSADMNSRAVKRIEQVTLLRTSQFAEDAGPMAHPVRPDSFIEISNFYTLTVYEKGSEVVRMLANLLGPELFRKGTDLYFERHDGQAVTCDDFVRAMEEVSGRDLAQFKNWYSQAGTPVLAIVGKYDADAATFTLDVKQSCPPTPGQSAKKPFHIPLKLALLGDAGALRLQLKGEPVNAESEDNTEIVLDITQPQQSFVFENLPEAPVPSLLRGFSAPVRLQYPYTRDELYFLVRNDSDGFSRWDAGQQLAVQSLQEMMSAYRAGNTMQIDARIIEAFRTLLADETLDAAMVSQLLTLPSEAYLAEIAEMVDIEAIHVAREAARAQIAQSLPAELNSAYQRCAQFDGESTAANAIAARSLKNACLAYLMLIDDAQTLSICEQQWQGAKNMTDSIAALAALVNCPFERAQPLRSAALEQFYTRWKHESLVVNQWFQLQATCKLPGTLEQVKKLMQHEAFDFKNPNKLRAVIAAFCGMNAINFHVADGEGYRFLTDQIVKLNASNPQMASRLLNPLTKWKKYPPEVQTRMREALQRVMAQQNLSKDVFEVVSKSLA